MRSAPGVCGRSPQGEGGARITFNFGCSCPRQQNLAECAGEERQVECPTMNLSAHYAAPLGGHCTCWLGGARCALLCPLKLALHPTGTAPKHLTANSIHPSRKKMVLVSSPYAYLHTARSAQLAAARRQLLAPSDCSAHPTLSALHPLCLLLPYLPRPCAGRVQCCLPPTADEINITACVCISSLHVLYSPEPADGMSPLWQCQMVFVRRWRSGNLAHVATPGSL